MKFPKLLVAVLLSFGLISCKNTSSDHINSDIVAHIETVNWKTKVLETAPGLEVSIVFSSDDSVLRGDGKRFKSKKKFDFLHFFQGESADKGNLWINHEDYTANADLGDGGGGTILELEKKNNKWTTLEAYHVDFSQLGETNRNCLGAATPWGTILTSEEIEFSSNSQLSGKGLTDSSDFDGSPRYLNYGWMVEVDIKTKKAIKKHYAMGRFMHEGAYCMPDSKTVYLIDDEAPCVFFKFVSDKAGDYSEGTLFAYQQSENLQSGKWLPLKRDRETMNHARREAMKLGATIFIRMEDIEPDGKGGFYVTETGVDEKDYTPFVEMGATIAKHLSGVTDENKKVHDYHGRLLHYSPSTEKISVFLEAGASADGKIVLSNPDNIAYDAKRNRLIIHEDINDVDQGRTNGIQKRPTNEIYTLDLNKSPSLSNLKRIAVIPYGGESTGPSFTDDFSTLFFNIQHPSPKNPSPYNANLTIALSGFDKN